MRFRGSVLTATVTLGAMFAPGAPVRAQDGSVADSAVLTGRVINKVGGTGVEGAQVTLPALGRTSTTDSAGRFRLTGLPAGIQSVQIRRVGFTELTDTVTLAPGRELSRLYSMAAVAPTLDTVRTKAQQSKYISPSLSAFEERRLSRSGGYFVSDSVFRANESRTLGDILRARMPNLLFTYISEHRIAVSGRKKCSGPVLMGGSACPNNMLGCFVAIYADGNLVFNTKIAQFMNPSGYPDIDVAFPVTQLAGAEFYASSALAPTGMQIDDDGCGSLWLWTREK
jgi:Carboxypeptidase regulatory-like domain